MTTSQYRLVELVGRLCDDSLSDAEFMELEGLLSCSAAARREYHAMIATHLRLGQLEESQLAPNPVAPVPVAPRWLGQLRSMRHPVPLSLLASSLVLAMLLLSLAYWVLPVWRESEVSGPGVVAHVIRSREAQWSPASLVRGQAPLGLVSGKPLELVRGTVAIRFESGTVAMLAGPATFAAQSRNDMQLLEGELVARVPPRAVGFAVRTPTIDVVDLGTEFSVHAGASQTVVQVGVGSVAVRRGAGGEEGADRVLTAGQAAQFEPALLGQDFTMREVEMNPAIFSRLGDVMAAPERQWVEGSLIQYAFQKRPDDGGFQPTLVRQGVFSSASAITPNNLTIFDMFPKGEPKLVKPTRLGVAAGEAGAKLETAFKNGWYFEFSCTIAPGVAIDLTELSFQAARGGKVMGRGFAVTSSLTGHTLRDALMSTRTMTAALPSFSEHVVDLSDPAFRGLSSGNGIITFRFYIFAQGNTHGMDFDNITVTGRVTKTPEPSAKVSAHIGLASTDSAGRGHGSNTPFGTPLFQAPVLFHRKLPEGTPCL